jgi:hypothetical protein
MICARGSCSSRPAQVTPLVPRHISRDVLLSSLTHRGSHASRCFRAVSVLCTETKGIRLPRSDQIKLLVYQQRWGQATTEIYLIYLISVVAWPQTASVAKWSEFLATDPETRVRFPALPEKKKRKK